MTINEDLVDELLTHDYDDERIHAAARALAESDRQLRLYAGFSALLRARYPDAPEATVVEASGVGTLIETLEQLDALPVGTIVIEDDGSLAQSLFWPIEPNVAWSYFGTDYFGTSGVVLLPARVLLLGTAA